MEQDNTNQDQTQQTQSEAFDQEAFLQRINENIKQSLSETQQNQPQPQTQQTQQQPVQQDEFGNYIQQYTAPAVQQANFAAAAAIDYTKFYTKNKIVKDGDEDIAEGTISQAMASEIEKTFETMAKQGRVASREEIHSYLVGRDLVKSPSTFVEKQTAKRQAKVQAARNNSDIGVSSQVNQMTTDQLHGMSMEQLTKSMENVNF